MPHTANRACNKVSIHWLNDGLSFVPGSMLTDSLMLRNRQYV